MSPLDGCACFHLEQTGWHQSEEKKSTCGFSAELASCWWPLGHDLLMSVCHLMEGRDIPEHKNPTSTIGTNWHLPWQPNRQLTDGASRGFMLEVARTEVCWRGERVGKFAPSSHINKGFISAGWSFSRPSAPPRVNALMVLAIFNSPLDILLAVSECFRSAFALWKDFLLR